MREAFAVKCERIVATRGDRMALRRGTKVDRGYATVVGDEGVNYRDIAETMTELGFNMNHSSARNYVIRIMKKFAQEFSAQWGLDLSEKKIDAIAKSPMFQQGISEILHNIEATQKDRYRNNGRQQKKTKK